MSLRDTWVKAKTQSKKDFKTACKAKQDELARKAKGGDKAAQEKFVRGQLNQMGLADDEDPDKFFKFKADLGPNLDKVEKQLAAAAQVIAERKKLTAARILIDYSMLEKTEKLMEGDTQHLFRFLGQIDNMDSVTAYKTFVEGPPFNKLQGLPAVKPLADTGGDPAKLKAANAQKLFQDLKTFVMNSVGPRLDKRIAGGKGDVAKTVVPSPPGFEEALKGAVAAIESYERAIKDSIAKWSDPKPDFRKPLTDALDGIRAVLDKVDI